MDRDEYVRKLKAQIDEWNAQMVKWQAAGEDFKNKYLQQLDELQVRRDQALAELRRLQEASASAWSEMIGGADGAFQAMQDAFDKAQREFSKKK